AWTRHTIVTQYTTNSMDVADMDHDGDIDIITQEHRGTKKLQIWDNDGCGNFAERIVDTGVEGHLGARVADLDHDGDLDIFSIAFDAYSDLYLWRNDNGSGTAPEDGPPVARIRVDDSLPGPAPAMATFDATSSTPQSVIASYNWQFSDGGSASGPAVTHTFATDGVVTATLTVVTGQGNRATAQTTLYVGVPAEGLIGSWKFDEATGNTAFDQSARGNSMQLHSGATRDVGYYGNALRLDGIDDYAARSDSALSGDFPAKSDGSGLDFTFAAWINLDALGIRQPIIQKQGDAQRGINFWIEDDNRLGCELFSDQENKTVVQADTPVTSGRWYHVALTYMYAGNGTSTVHLYLDGALVGSTDAAVGPVVPNSVDLNLGRYVWSSAYARYFDGRMDDVLVYQRALTLPEIAVASAPLPDGDADGDGVVDAADAAALTACLAGPGDRAWENCRQVFDFDHDTDVDLADAARLQLLVGPAQR
ncbi:MAG TPA: PKD domain-containing protein, partial [Phycisphaerae bacterium]|nr:PKD domain-containing protein [Phycisphaerae bacterium]